MKNAIILIVSIVGIVFVLVSVSDQHGKTTSAQPETAAQATVEPLHIGQTGYVKAPWICAATPDAYKHAAAWAARGDQDEMDSTLLRENGAFLAKDTRVKVLDREGWLPILYRIRVLNQPEPNAVMARVGFECYVDSDMIR